MCCATEGMCVAIKAMKRIEVVAMVGVAAERVRIMAFAQAWATRKKPLSLRGYYLGKGWRRGRTLTLKVKSRFASVV